ncbi:MAG: M20 family metallopeptidase [Sediminibacterium sp.]|nr:M20 family metallopeptidase [Sediminibacterium sp.]
MLKKEIQQLASEKQADWIEIRRFIHQNPELSFQEYNTANFIKEKLISWGIDCRIIGGTGVVALLHGKNPQKNVIALRADIDALPIKEENQCNYVSKNEGVMHACGHDVHTTILLGTAFILKQFSNEWEGTIKLIFQPGEEKNPGGASILIKEGVLENPKPACILGLHVHPNLLVNHLSFRGGRVMASADELYIDIKGTGGHAAAPQLTVDTIYVASTLIVALQQIISRNNHALNPSILSICSIQGGSTTNVIPQEVKLKGTFRALNEEWRKQGHTRIKEICAGIASATNAVIDCHIDIGYPCVDNNEKLSKLAMDLAIDLHGQDHVSETEIRLGAEDFGYYTQQIPGCFYRLGVRSDAQQTVRNVHTSTFNVDEQCLAVGVATMAFLAVNLVDKFK